VKYLFLILALTGCAHTYQDIILRWKVAKEKAFADQLDCRMQSVEIYEWLPLLKKPKYEDIKMACDKIHPMPERPKECE
jgi:hypothetical protein